MSGNRAPDRIKRSIMKQDYGMGGLKVPDLLALDEALKLRQFFRACKSNHPIQTIQEYIIQGLEYDNVIAQEYNRISKIDLVIASAQTSLNFLTDKWRNELLKNVEEGNTIQEQYINLVAATDVKEFLQRKKQTLITCFYERLFNSGIENFKQLVTESLYPRSDAFRDLTSIVLKAFPPEWATLIRDNFTCNPEIEITSHIATAPKILSEAGKCTVGMLKARLVKFEPTITPPFEIKLNLKSHEGINPFLTARIVNYSTNLRIFKFRLLHMDIFCKERMFKFKMTNNDSCDNCGSKETVRHVLWDCNRAKEVWNNLNEILSEIHFEHEIKFEHLFIGFKPTIPFVESILTRLCQILLRVDRSQLIMRQTTIGEIKILAAQYVTCKKVNAINNELWKEIIKVCTSKLNS